MSLFTFKFLLLFQLFEIHLTLGPEWCELGCEEWELNLYLNECRNACGRSGETKAKNKMEEYLNCMFKTCVMNGIELNDEEIGDEVWIKCADQCNREELLEAHEATEKPIFHTQYLSEKQFDNFKIVNNIKSKIKVKKSVNS